VRNQPVEMDGFLSQCANVMNIYVYRSILVNPAIGMAIESARKTLIRYEGYVDYSYLSISNLDESRKPLANGFLSIFNLVI